MEDGAQRYKPVATSPGSASSNTILWQASLYIAEAHNNNITLLDSVRWGFTLAPAESLSNPNSISMAPVPEPGALGPFLFVAILAAMTKRKGRTA